MAQNNMRKMFTEQQIIDLVKQHQDEIKNKQQKYHLTCVGFFVDVDENYYYIIPQVYTSTPVYSLVGIMGDSSVFDGAFNPEDKTISINGNEIVLDSASICLYDFITGEIISLVDL